MRFAVILYITLTFIVTTHANEQANADGEMTQEIAENLSIIDNPANVLNAEVTQCQDESKKSNCDSYFASLTDQERRLLKAKLTCFSQADVTKCGVIAGWLKRKLPGYEHTDTAKYRSLIQSNFAFLEKHQAALSLCLPEYDQLARNLCLLKPNLDALQIKLQKIRVTPEGLFNDYDREVEWLVMKTKDQDLELSTPVSSIGRKGINSFYVTKVITGRGQSNRRSVFEKPLGVYSLIKQEIHLENPKLTTSSEDYYGRELKSVNFEYGADFKFGMNKLKPNITVCESLSEAPSLIAEARAKLGNGWDPNNSTKLAQEAIAAAEREGLQIGLYNLQDAGKGFVEGIEGLIKLLKNEETPDPEGQNQCVKEENKKIAADFGSTCSGMFTILKRALGDEADALMNPCYTQHCPGKTPAECFMSQQVNPILRGKIAGCVGYMMKERYGPGIIKLIQKCTGQTGANEFSRCMADISVMAAGGALTAGIAQGVVAGSALAQSGLKAAVEAGKLSVNAVKWLSRGVNATKFAGLFAADLLFNPLPTDPVDLLKTRKGLLALIKDGKAPKDLLDQAQKKLTEVDAAIKASEDAKALNLTTDTQLVSNPKTTPADTLREEKLTSELAQNMHASWKKTFQAKNGDAPRNKPVPLDADETPQAALKRLEAEGYQGLSIEDGKLVQNINQDSKAIVPSLSLALNGGPASDYAKIALNGKFDTPADIEKMADEVHKKWMKHNEWQKDSAPQLFVEYSKLTPEEKLKDLDVLEEALRLKDPKILETDAYKKYRKALTDEISAASIKPEANSITQFAKDQKIPESIKEANSKADDTTRRRNIKRDLEEFRKTNGNSQPVSDDEVEAVMKAHEVYMKVNSKLEYKVGREKMKRMLAGGLNPDEARLMIKLAHAGMPENPISRIDLDDFFERGQTRSNITTDKPNANGKVIVQSTSTNTQIQSIELKGSANNYEVSVKMRDGSTQTINKATIDQADSKTSDGISSLLNGDTTQNSSGLLFRAVQTTLTPAPKPSVKAPDLPTTIAPTPAAAPAPAPMPPKPVTPAPVAPSSILSSTAPPVVKAVIDPKANLAKNTRSVYQPYFERYVDPRLDMLKKEKYTLNPSFGPKSSAGNTTGTIHQKLFSALDESSPNISAANKQLNELSDVMPKLGLDSTRQQHLSTLVNRAQEITAKGRANNDELGELFMIHRGIGMIIKDASGK